MKKFRATPILDLLGAPGQEEYMKQTHPLKTILIKNAKLLVCPATNRICLEVIKGNYQDGRSNCQALI